MKKVCGIWFLFLFLVPLKSQSIIGLSRDKIEDELKTVYPAFTRDKTFVNHTYNYLKFVDKTGNQTMLIFLSDGNICTSTKLMCDYSELNNIKLMLKQYKQVGKNKWIYKQNGKEFLVRLNREEWFFSLFTSLK